MLGSETDKYCIASWTSATAQTQAAWRQGVECLNNYPPCCLPCWDFMIGPCDSCQPAESKSQSPHPGPGPASTTTARTRTSLQLPPCHVQRPPPQRQKQHIYRHSTGSNTLRLPAVCYCYFFCCLLGVHSACGKRGDKRRPKISSTPTLLIDLPTLFQFRSMTIINLYVLVTMIRML